MITYKPVNTNERTNVYLDGKRVGVILKISDRTLISGYGYQYYPANSEKGGEVFNTLSECKHSLESETT